MYCKYIIEYSFRPIDSTHCIEGTCVVRFTNNMVSKGKIRLKGGGVEIAACLGGKEREIFLLQNISISNSLSTDFLAAFYKRMKRFNIKFNFRFKKNG